jgi:tetratricopeptide (TPR) repeat protein
VIKKIDSWASRQEAHQCLTALLAALDRNLLVGFLRALEAGPSWEWAVGEIRGSGLIDGGAALADATLVAEGIAALREAFPEPSPHARYNIANGDNALWEIALRAEGPASAILTARKHLHAARRGYEAVGGDESAESALRAQSLVNAGNSYDNLGRDQEALGLWDEALALDPDFAMARGNRAIALLHASHFAGEHGAMLHAEAYWDLERALAQSESILQYGGPSAMERFQEARARFRRDVPLLPPSKEPWSDPHLAWCRRHELFLHTSHRCLSEDQPTLDTLFFASLSGLVGEERRGDDLSDSINAIKQEYVSVRFLTWLSLEPDTPVSAAADAVKGRVRFLDSFNFGRWGVRTGLAIQAFVSTTNLLDKIAVVAHAYFQSGRNPKRTYFRTFWHAKRDGIEQMETVFAAAFDLGWNPGLAALCDLANDLEDETPLSKLVAMRHTATHRLLVAHDASPPPSADWLTRIAFDEIAARSVEQLRLARGAILYLVRAIDAHEKNLEGTRGKGVFIPIPTVDVDTGLTEID